MPARETLPSLARYTVRSARAVLRRAGRHRWWTVTPDSGSGYVLRPAQLHDADAWLRLVRRCGERPPGHGLRASALGGVAITRADWMQRCLVLRAAARRGEVYPYLVHHHGILIGEALGHVDLGDATVDTVVWLPPDERTAERESAVVTLLARHVLSGPAEVRHARCLVPAAAPELVAALGPRGFVVAGRIVDPPSGDQCLLVASRPTLDHDEAAAA